MNKYQEALDRIKCDLTPIIKDENITTMTGFIDFEFIQELIDNSQQPNVQELKEYTPRFVEICSFSGNKEYECVCGESLYSNSGHEYWFCPKCGKAQDWSDIDG